MNFLRRNLVNLIQRFNRHFNSAYLERIYQTSYLNMAQRTEWLGQIPLASPSGGTASFSLLYILLAILRDVGVSSLLELGVGQSSILLIQYAQHFKRDLTLIDDDEEWLRYIVQNTTGISAVHAKLTETKVCEKAIHWYDCERLPKTFDLLLVDGPMSYSRPLRYNRLGILNWLPDIMREEFIIIVDDTSRIGERLLVDSVEERFKRMDCLPLQKREITGGNSQTIVATPKFKKYLYL